MRRPSDPETHYKRLRRWMILAVILTSFTPMILVGGVIHAQFKASYKEKVHAHLTTLIRKHTQNIDTFLTEKRNNIQFLAKASDFDTLRREDALRRLLDRLQEEYGTIFEDLGVVGADGLQAAYAGPFKLDRADYAGAEWFKRAIGSPHSISDVFAGLRGFPHFIVAVRIDVDGAPWLLRATIDFMAFNALVENIRIGRTGFAFIINREGEFQTAPVGGVAPDGKRYAAMFDRRTTPGGNGVLIQEGKDAFGREAIFVGAFLKGGDWLMIYQQNTDDAFADLNQAQAVAVLIFLMGGLCIVAMAVIVSHRMVDRIRRADQDKELMNKQVIETGKLASIGQLAAGIAHEINNPVAIMVEEAGWIEDLLADEEFQESANLAEFRRALGQINTQGRRCKEITHKLLSFARKTDARVQEVDVNDLILELVGLSSQRARYGSVAVETRLAPDLPDLNASPTELQQVLLNLINNALDAMERGGGILEIATRREDGAVVITVADTGSGIPRANMERIFDPFFTTKPVGKGTGLGLSICYGIVKKLDGDIQLESEMGKGTTFTLRIPVSGGREQSR